MFMTNEQVGLYIRLLCAQHQHDGKIYTNVLRTQCDSITGGDTIFAKFDHDGQFSFNTRLRDEMQKRAEKAEKARDSVNKRWEKHRYDSNTNVLRSEDVNVNENIDVIIIDNKVKKKEKKEIEILTPEFERYQDWAARNFPDLLKFDQPLTDQQLQALFDQFKNKTLVREKLEAIGNTKGAKKKYSTVYATCRNWCKLSLERGWKDPTPNTSIGQDVWSKTLQELRKRDETRQPQSQLNETN